MEQRQEELLTLVIESYMATAEPVGSRFLVDIKGLDWSEATVRNELRFLEEEGFLTHPHTSAGRVPTTKGYRYYVEKIDLEKLHLSRSEDTALTKSFSGDYEPACKSLAKELVNFSGESIIMAFSADRIYYTGLSNLFSKPDFAEIQLVANVSRVFDRCEEYLPRFYSRVDSQPHCYLGKDHPFGELFSCVATRFGKDNESLVVLLGPERMDYRHNWSLVKKARELV